MAERFDRQRVVALLDVDPDLGVGLGEDELALARQRALAGVVELEPPDWDTIEIREQAQAGLAGAVRVGRVVVAAGAYWRAVGV